MASMFFLFMVTASGASFQQAQPMPDPFAPSNVVAMLDSASSGYSNFMTQNLIAPASDQFAFIGQDVAFVADNAGPGFASLTGMQNLGSSHVAYSVQPEVAGASGDEHCSGSHAHDS